jgi:hypothetical protein
LHTRQLPGLPPEQSADGQEDREHEPAARRPDQGEDDYPTVFEQYHIFTTPEKEKRNNL